LVSAAFDERRKDMTGRARALLLTTAVAIASNCYAQDLKSYRQKYDDGLQKIVADHQQRTGDITKTYATGLNSLKASLFTWHRYRYLSSKPKRRSMQSLDGLVGLSEA